MSAKTNRPGGYNGLCDYAICISNYIVNNLKVGRNALQRGPAHTQTESLTHVNTHARPCAWHTGL